MISMTKFKAFLKNYRFLICMAVILVLTRLAMVLFDQWCTVEGGDLPEGMIGGNYAFDVLNHVFRGWSVYLYITSGHLGAMLLVGIYAFPLFKLFGTSLFVLCFVPIILSLGILTLMYVLSEKYFNKTTAKLSTLFFVCTPFELVNWEAIPYCLQFDSAIYCLGALGCTMGIIYSRESRKQLIFAGLLGLISGIALFQSELYLATLGCIMVIWLWRQPKFLIQKAGAIFFIGLFIGLIPYIYFGGLRTLLSFVERIGRGGFSFSRNREFDVTSLTTLKLYASAYWPFRNLFFLKFNPVLVTVLSALAMLSTLFFKPDSEKQKTAVRLWVFYSFGFFLLMVLMKISIRYYITPNYAASMMVLAFFLSRVLEWLGQKTRYSKQGFWTIWLVLSVWNWAPIVQGVELGRLNSQLKKQLTARGYCFWWPYGYQAYSGFKTSTQREVEKYVRVRGHGFRWALPDPPYKEGYLNSDQNIYVPLHIPEDYFNYGIDVTYRGFDSLAKEITEKVPPQFQLNAYKGLAVISTTDYLLKDLYSRFKDNHIETSVPESFHSLFYIELGRKLRENYPTDKSQIEKQFGFLEGQRKAWVLSGYEQSQYVKEADLER